MYPNFDRLSGCETFHILAVRGPVATRITGGRERSDEGHVGPEFSCLYPGPCRGMHSKQPHRAIEIEDVVVRVSELERSAELSKGRANCATRPTVGSANAETEAADNSGVGG